jgi:hypothetical protein
MNNISNFQKDTYLNTGYRNDRTDNQMVILNSKSISSDARAEDFLHNNVYYKLNDPLYIDSNTDVFLEYIHFQNVDFDGASTTHIEKTPYFCIDIPELDIKTYSNNDYLSNKFIIPNDTFGDTDEMQNDSVAEVSTYHVKIKSNFISTIQPKTIRGFHVSITGFVPDADSGVSGISTIAADSSTGRNHFTGQFNKYYLSNAEIGAGNFNTCGNVKIALLFKKRHKLNKQVLKLQDGSYNDLIYKNTQYFNDRSIYQVLVLDSIMSTTVNNLPSGGGDKNSREANFFYNNVIFNLLETLYIDTKCEMYIEYINFNNQMVLYDTSTFDGTANDKTDARTHLEASSSFYIDIPELKIKTFTNDSYAANKYVLPNENYGKTDDNANDNDTNVETYHIKLKRNFIGIIEPTTLKRLTMSITADDSFKHATDKYFIANKSATTAATSSSVQVAILFRKIWD